MFKYLAAFVAVAVLLVAAGSASAHGDVVFVRDAFGNVRAVRVDNGFHHAGPRNFNRNFFNQNGGRNRFGFRR